MTESLIIILRHLHIWLGRRRKTTQAPVPGFTVLLLKSEAIRAVLRAPIGGPNRKVSRAVVSGPTHASHFRKHLKTHGGEKTIKCNLCDFA